MRQCRMVTIRPSQVAALDQAVLRAFVRQTLPEIRRAWPSRCVGRTDEELLGELLPAAEMAVACGITGDHSLQAFLNLRMMLGFRFPTAAPYAWALAILRDPALPGRAKLARIHARLTERG